MAEEKVRTLRRLERDVRRHRSPDGRRIAELEDACDTLRTALAAAEKKLCQALADGHARDEELTSQLREARDDADRLRRALAEQDMLIRTLHSRLTEAEEGRREAEEKATAEAARADELAGRLSDADTQLAAAARLVSDADQDAARAEQRATELRTEIEVLYRRLITLLQETPSGPVAFTPPPSTHDGENAHNPAELVPAQLQPSVAEGATTHTTATAAPALRPVPAPHGRTPQPVRTRKRRRPRPDQGRSRPERTRLVAWAFALLLVAAAGAAFAAAHIQRFAYTHAALCTAARISRAETGDCLTQQTGTVTDRAEKSDADATSYTVTVAVGGRHKTWNVKESFYNGTRPGTRVAVNTYDGTIVTLTHGTLTADVADGAAFLSWKQMVAPLALMTAAAIALIAVADRFFRPSMFYGLLPIAALWNVSAALLTFNNWGSGSWTGVASAVVHALAWTLACLPPLAMAALD
ncbi:hypothetical protein ACSNOK_07880 [Streptomyces sp. URMC 126]|uniref:hypothetical protein n=1 Tax=Streptomyces sp. URMC 126 TaxID=3423401 RepID=UPI003F1BEFA4